jgi:hypothetical protein
VTVEATQTIGDVDPRAEDECRALVEHSAGEVERCHRILRWMLDEHTYLGPAVGVLPPCLPGDTPKVVSFVGRVSPRSGTRRCK